MIDILHAEHRRTLGGGTGDKGQEEHTSSCRDMWRSLHVWDGGSADPEEVVDSNGIPWLCSNSG